MSKCLDWGVLLILVGEGQDIYQKEIGSLQIWADTLSPDWEVACPSKLLPVFKRAKFVEDKLNLTVSLRTHTAGQYSKFVNMMIAGYTKEAKDLKISLFILPWICLRLSNIASIDITRKIINITE